MLAYRLRLSSEIASSRNGIRAIAGFRDGTIKVLVNVIVATEGFDLPDASCIAIARPTMSLALYLQMVGRGLRPKDDNCLILDLAANSVTHGLPEEDREWSLEPRGEQFSGEAPIVWCPECETVSHAAGHHCLNCGYAFGKDCGRCGKWRAWKRWRFEDFCGDAHQLVCDLCHIDAHIQAHLPVIEPLDELIDIYDPEDDMTEYPPINDDLSNRLAILLKELLKQEKRSFTGAADKRRNELRHLIEQRKIGLANEVELERLFESYLDDLPVDQRPSSNLQKWRMFGDWESSLKSELAEWKNELDELENRPVDKKLIFNSARNKVMHLLRREAGPLPPEPPGSGEKKKKGGRKGYDHLQDYLIPVIRLMRNGTSHTEAFRLVAQKLNVNSTTVASQCTRALRLSTQEFKEHVESGRIVQIIKNQYPDKRELIERELG